MGATLSIDVVCICYRTGLNLLKLTLVYVYETTCTCITYKTKNTDKHFMIRFHDIRNYWSRVFRHEYIPSHKIYVLWC